MKNYIYPATIIVLVVAMICSVQRCSGLKKTSEANAVASLKELVYYKNKLLTETASVQALQLDKKQMQDMVFDKDAQLEVLASEFAKVHTVIKYDTRTVYDTIAVVFKDTVPCVFTRSGHVAQKWYSFGYRADQKGIEIDTLSFPNTATVITGTKRKWFLGKEVLTTDITNTNPYIKVTGITAAELILPAPWYKKWYVWLAAGALSGAILTK